jgi:hypothetical protein
MEIVELLTDFQTVTTRSDCTRTYDPFTTLRVEIKFQSRGRRRIPILSCALHFSPNITFSQFTRSFRRSTDARYPGKRE